jgi:hypothetical protein
MTNFSDYRSLNPDECVTLEKVLDVLFPDEPDGIGAVSAGALRYVDGTLAGRAAHLRETYRAGVRWLHEQARARGGDRFEELPRGVQEAIVDDAMERTRLSPTPLDAKVEEPANRGAADGASRTSLDLLFMTALWQHTREGLFGDPRHGGNANGMVWKWLGYSGPQLNGYTDSEILENETPSRPLRFAEYWTRKDG